MRKYQKYVVAFGWKLLERKLLNVKNEDLCFQAKREKKKWQTLCC